MKVEKRFSLFDFTNDLLGGGDDNVSSESGEEKHAENKAVVGVDPFPVRVRLGEGIGQYDVLICSDRKDGIVFKGRGL